MHIKKDNCIEALIVYNFLGSYMEFEKKIKKEFISQFKELDEDYKNRVYFYLGGVKGLGSFIDYDTYSVIKEIHKYDKTSLLSHLTMNQIIKLERKEEKISSFKRSVPSLQVLRAEYTFYDCCIKLINTRNKMAHEFFELDIKDKDIIDVLSKEKVTELCPDWLKNLQYDDLSSSMLGILSNYIYMEEMKKSF